MGETQEFLSAKLHNGKALADIGKQRLGVTVDPASMFDVHTKRIHEYKRQLLNVLHVITRYDRIREGVNQDDAPRTVIFAGKAAPGYAMAKLIIKLITQVADFVDNDPRVHDRLKVVFIPNYDVSTAADIVPAAELSEQFSMAGAEASGTGNINLYLNGALTIGTLDGANIEIREKVGPENVFIFGLTAEEISEIRPHYRSWEYYHHNVELRQVLDMLPDGYLSPAQPDLFRPLVDALTHGGDGHMLLSDYEAYIDYQGRIDGLYRDRRTWAEKAILNVARIGKFSADRTTREYAERTWKISPVHHD